MSLSNFTEKVTPRKEGRQLDDFPVRMGKVTKDKEGNPVLINPQGKAYAINEKIVRVWELLNGKNRPEDVISGLSSTYSLDQMRENEVQAEIFQMIKKLKSVNLAS